MGLTGLEGVFRNTMTICMGILRSHKETLLSVIEPFVKDPTVAWQRSGRAQQKTDSVKEKAPTKQGKEYVDGENTEAVKCLAMVNGRLSGLYNLTHPHFEKITKAYFMRRQTPPSRGLGACKEEILPLSVSGQVSRLIEEATCEMNLAQMYIGWQPWN